MMEKFKNGEYFIYVNGDKYELGKVKRENDNGTAYFCYYHEGNTCAWTPIDCMHKLVNAYIIREDGFGKAEMPEKRMKKQIEEYLKSFKKDFVVVIYHKKN